MLEATGHLVYVGVFTVLYGARGLRILLEEGNQGLRLHRCGRPRQKGRGRAGGLGTKGCRQPLCSVVMVVVLMVLLKRRRRG
eukprot:1494077-Lingulodinium_polyedra.AAC.1